MPKLQIVLTQGYTLTHTSTGWTDGTIHYDTLEDTIAQCFQGYLFLGTQQVAQIRMDEHPSAPEYDLEELVITFNTARIEASALVSEHFPSFDPENVAVAFHNDAPNWCSMRFESFDLGR
tara:strand:+ start:71 stop:430 length:360 start_codon:yes stop_codon:yes gene_type:complete